MSAPWPVNRLKKLGDCIREGREIPADVPVYDEVMLWYNDIATSVQQVIESADWSDILGPTKPEVTSRAKTIDTLRDKLIRSPSYAMPSIQDIAGVRFDAEMSLDQQDLVAARIAELFKHDPASSIRDLRSDPHSGYRAVHVWLRLDGRVEVQVRTHLQSAWANAYEAAGDHFGRSIRYGAVPKNAVDANIVRLLRELSEEVIAPLEIEGKELARLERMIETQVTGAIPPAVRRERRDHRHQVARLRAGQITREADLQIKMESVRYALLDLRKP